MPLEIERKFLLANNQWRKACTAGTPIQQGFLSTHKARTVRVRIKGAKAYLAVKGFISAITRTEYEYPIPMADAHQLLQLCAQPHIEKVRYQVNYQGLVWEIDQFEGANKGLIIAEVELQSETQALSLPPWVGKEVTGQAKYYNANLIAHPYTSW